MDIIVNGCDDCPFCEETWDYECYENPGLRHCNLKKHCSQKSYNYCIGTFLHNPPPTPIWCPLKAGSVVVRMKD